jgi:hypothetical protein
VLEIEQTMFEQISKLISVLSDTGVLSRDDVIDALADFARGIEDSDYRSRMFRTPDIPPLESCPKLP